MKTNAEIESLKREWEADPIWDIEDTEGFEEHRMELKEYRINMETQWMLNEQGRLLARANAMGIPGNIQHVRHIEALEYQIGNLQTQIDSLSDAIDLINRKLKNL